MKLPNFYGFVPLNAIRVKMGIPSDCRAPPLPQVVSNGRLTALELEIIASPKGLDISADKLIVLPDGTLAYKNSRVILYIRDVIAFGNRITQPRFHLADCETLQKMKRGGKFDKYVVSTSTNGQFDLNIINAGVPRAELTDLSVCQHCLKLLRFEGFEMSWLQSKRIDFVSQFKIERFFEQFPKSLHMHTPTYNSDNAPVNIYPDDFNAISQKVRSDSGWCCQQCGNDLSAQNERKWLHAHHKNSLKHDNKRENLEALCIGCHAEKPNHGHIKSSLEYSEYLIAKGLLYTS